MEEYVQISIDRYNELVEESNKAKRDLDLIAYEKADIEAERKVYKTALMSLLNLSESYSVRNVEKRDLTDYNFRDLYSVLTKCAMPKGDFTLKFINGVLDKFQKVNEDGTNEQMD